MRVNALFAAVVRFFGLRSGRVQRGLQATLLVLLVAGWPQVSQAESKPAGEIEAGFPQFPPYGFVNDSGQPDGLDVRVARVVFDKLGVPWRPAIYPATRLFRNLQDSSTMFSILVRVPVLEACCLYSKKPVMHDEIRVYHYPDKPVIKSKEDLAGKRIITLRGFSYGGLISFFNDAQNRIANNETPSHESALAMLRAGRADYAVFYGAAVSLLGPEAMTGLKYGVISDLSIYLVLNKSYPNAEKAMLRMEAIAETINKDELYKPFAESAKQ